jgi:hypothetical protein
MWSLRLRFDGVGVTKTGGKGLGSKDAFVGLLEGSVVAVLSALSSRPLRGCIGI